MRYLYFFCVISFTFVPCGAFATTDPNACLLALKNMQTATTPVPQALETIQQILAQHPTNQSTLLALGQALKNPHVLNEIPVEHRASLMRQIVTALKNLKAPVTNSLLSLNIPAVLSIQKTTEVLQELQKGQAQDRYLSQLIEAALLHREATVDTFNTVRLTVTHLQNIEVFTTNLSCQFLNLALMRMRHQNLDGPELQETQDLLQTMQKQAAQNRQHLTAQLPSLQRPDLPNLKIPSTISITDLHTLLNQVRNSPQGALPLNYIYLTLSSLVSRQTTNGPILMHIAQVLENAKNRNLLLAKETHDIARLGISRAQALLRDQRDPEQAQDATISHAQASLQRFFR